MGLGVLLAIIGPLLLVPVVWLLYRFAARPVVRATLGQRFSAAGVRWIALGLSILVVGATMASSYYPGWREFHQVCSEHGTPQIVERVHVDGFFRTRMFPYEAHPFLDSFSFIEAPDPYKKDVTVRYTRVGEELHQEEVTTLLSQYAVRKEFSETPSGITMMEKHIYEISTNRELARAANITYHGGPLWLFLGSHGMLSCPDILSEQGSRDFGTFYDLETLILNSGTGYETPN